MLDIDSTLLAQPRQPHNKSSARKLRRLGRVPAVAYGPGQTSAYLSLDPNMFVLQRKRFGGSHLYDVKVLASSDGTQPAPKGDAATFKVVIKDVAVHPVSRKLMHVDLYKVDMNKPIRVDVPIELVGKAAGIIEGGLLSQVLRQVEVTCLPNDIPQKIVADVTPLKLGDSLHLSDLPLPVGVKLTAHGDEAVALVAAPEAAPASEAPAAAGAAAPGATAGAAAPAAAKAPAAKTDKK